MIFYLHVLPCFLTYNLEIWTKGVIFDVELNFYIGWPIYDKFDTIWPIFLFFDIQTLRLDGGVISDAKWNFDISLPSFDILDLCFCFVTYRLEIWTMGVTLMPSWFLILFDLLLIFLIPFDLLSYFFYLHTWNLDKGCNFWCWIEFCYHLAFFWYFLPCLPFGHFFLKYSYATI